MKRKPFAAFGRVLYANYYDAGEVVNFTTRSDSKTVLFFTDADLTIRDLQTNAVAYQCVPGWFKSGDYVDGQFTFTVNQAGTSWCYDPLVNHDYVPIIEPFILKQGITAELAVNSNLFVCSGTLQVNGQPVQGPYQLAVRTGAAALSATTDVYGLIFK